MKGETVLDILRTYTKDELFYKEMQEARKDPKTLEEFLARHGLQEAIEHKWIVPEYRDQGGWMPEMMGDALLFEVLQNNEILVSKHNRYTPMFEHRHAFFEFAYVVEGSCIQRFNEKEITIHQGQMTIIPPYSTHAIGVFDDSIVINICVKRQVFEMVFNSILRYSNVITDFFARSLYLYQQADYMILDTKNDQDLQNTMLQIVAQSLEKKPFDHVIMISLLLYWFGKMLQTHEDGIYIPSLPYQNNEKVLEIITYIEGHFQNATLKETASKFSFSEGYLSRLIKKSTGKTFTDLVLDMKFDKAINLLETSRQPILEISYLAGFESVEHFNRSFKKRFQMTPTTWRKVNYANRSVQI